jgi:hypothetical protein
MLSLATKEPWPPKATPLGEKDLKWLETDYEFAKWLETDHDMRVVVYFVGPCGSLGLFVATAISRIAKLQRVIDAASPSKAWTELPPVRKSRAKVTAKARARARAEARKARASKAMAALSYELDEARRLLALVNAVKAAAARGRVHLTQKRKSTGEYAYLATRSLKREDW